MTGQTPYEIEVTIAPAVMPLDRGVIEDAVVEALGDGADVVDGGTELGPAPRSEFTIFMPRGQPRDQLALSVWRALSSIQFTMPTTFTVSIDGEDVPRPAGPS